MENQEFNLSSKHYNNIRVYAEEDVKEFIILLRKEICWCSNPSLKEGELCKDCKMLNKLVGDKLI